MNMINEFGVPMNEMEIANSNIKPHERMLAESGMEMQFWGGLIGAAVGTLFGSKRPRGQAVLSAPEKERWEDTQQYKDFQAQNKQLTSQISGLESSLANLNTTFSQQQELASQRSELHASTIKGFEGTINDLSSQLGEYKASQAARVQAADAAASYDIVSERNKGVKVNQGEELGKTGKIKPTTRSYFNRDSMRIGSGLTDQSVNV
tara:strand:+ start:262 stop:879 length:618 start_codon:yes stop_codon:yes gene_type:complete